MLPYIVRYILENVSRMSISQDTVIREPSEKTAENLRVMRTNSRPVSETITYDHNYIKSFILIDLLKV